jgi:Rrf2 family protein
MPIVARRGILAIRRGRHRAAGRRPSGILPKALAARHRLPRRHLEPVLQALAREGILKGMRGPGGGSELAGEPRDITAAQIVRATEFTEDARPEVELAVAGERGAANCRACRRRRSPMRSRASRWRTWCGPLAAAPR